MPGKLGKWSKFTLLTGAGWSHNWGGRLAPGLWELISDNAAVRNNPRLFALLGEEQSFEVALAQTHLPPYTASDRETLEQAIVAAFVSMDRAIGHLNNEGVHLNGVQKLLFRFSRRDEGVDTGFLFTLNQDLFLERHLYNAGTAPSPALPGVRPTGRQEFFSSLTKAYSVDYVMHVLDGKLDQERLAGHTNVIKLHGSFNWRTADGANVMVVGTDKTKQIADFPVLTWYRELFKRVLSAGGMRLMIVGYGFGDEHINEVIADAVSNHGLRVFIWDAGPDLKSRLLRAPHGGEIWGGRLSTASQPMIPVFPSDQSVTEEAERLYREFFGDRRWVGGVLT
jgi:SIR2-like domain